MIGWIIVGTIATTAAMGMVAGAWLAIVATLNEVSTYY